MSANKGYPAGDERRGAAQDRRAGGRAAKALLAERERHVRAREELIGAREGVAAQAKRELQRHIIKLRRANAHLVIATLGAQVTTEEMRRANDVMAYMAHHDFLTNLPNRLLLKERMAQAIAMARRQGGKMAVLFVDLDRFKVINDTLGHAVGDLLLQAVGLRLQSVMRGSDTASRQGGDEFVVLLAEIPNERAASEFAEKLCRALGEPYQLGGETVHIGGTIGISMYPDDGEEAEQLIHHADVAMYHGKQSARNHCYFYRPEMNVRALERQRVEADLHRALELGEFELHYQPRINLASGAITGAEALLRWTHPELGAVAPSRFIPVAEDCGLIVPIGHWVLHEACMQASRWQQSGLRPGVIAVNISALEFRNEGFADALRAVLAESGLAPQGLELEITEDVLMRDAAASAAILAELKEIGVQLAIDDFGTGNSSLSYLNRFPIDVLKIDQSFVREISQTPGEGVIVGAVIAMGSSLGQRVVAEGVEQQEQLNFLRAHHCDEGQGYLFSKPLPASAFAALLGNGAGGGRAGAFRPHNSLPVR